jgi:hypothetical protein
MEDFFCIRPAPRINKQSLFPTYGRLLLSRKGAETQRNLTANDSWFLALGSCIFFFCSQRRKEIYAQTALVSWLSAHGSRFFLLFARKDAKAQRNLTANGSNLLVLVSFLFLLAKAQRRKEIYAQTALGSCLLLLDT